MTNSHTSLDSAVGITARVLDGEDTVRNRKSSWDTVID